MRLDGQGTDDQALGDLGVGRPFGDQGEKFDLAASEVLRQAPAKQTIDQLSKLGEAQQANQSPYRAFLPKEQLRLLYQLDDPALAPAHLDAWPT